MKNSSCSTHDEHACPQKGHPLRVPAQGFRSSEAFGSGLSFLALSPAFECKTNSGRTDSRTPRRWREVRTRLDIGEAFGAPVFSGAFSSLTLLSLLPHVKFLFQR